VRSRSRDRSRVPATPPTHDSIVHGFTSVAPPSPGPLKPLTSLPATSRLLLYPRNIPPQPFLDGRTTGGRAVHLIVLIYKTCCPAKFESKASRYSAGTHEEDTGLGLTCGGRVWLYDIKMGQHSLTPMDLVTTVVRLERELPRLLSVVIRISLSVSLTSISGHASLVLHHLST